MRQSLQPWIRLLVLVLMASGAVLASGCHFHRHHHGYYLYDNLDYHPRYGSHHS